MSSIKLAGLYVGTVVGAGFASGQEVLQFFGFHGLGGVLGIAVAGGLFVVYGAMILILGNRLQASSHLEVVQASGVPWIGTAVDAVITFFLLGALSTMAAGSGAVFEEQFGVPYFLGSLAVVTLAVVTVIMGIERVVTAVSMVTPFLLGSVLIVCVLSIFKAPIDLAWADPERAALRILPLSSITYASYNLVLAIPLLAPAGALAGGPVLKRGALLGGIGLALGALGIHLAILTAVPEITRFEIPMLFLTERAFGPLSLVYSAVLLAEVYTTAVASLYGFTARMTNPQGKQFVKVAIATGAAAFIGSLLGFSELVAKVYSAVGIAGYTLLVTLILAYFRTRD